ncbi:MAG: MOSC domain-containing protein [Sphingobacteriales bacterium]|nr:MAG: MOSC domain-containing protein [Sphingobacteriales bacterium]
MITISSLHIYPIKSLGGIELKSATITQRGLEYDRRWMLVDEKNEFLTQRVYPQMTLLKTGVNENSITVYHLQNPGDIIELSLQPAKKETVTVKVWDDYCEAQYADDNINKWFSEKLGIACKAVYMPDDSKRKLDRKYALTDDDITGFADGYPILLISEASLDDLNSKLETPVPMDRFRPNIVITGTEAFAEDSMKHFIINNTNFYGVKLCGRCIITTTNQQTGERSKEPLKTLATYRTINNKVCFGQNVICVDCGKINIGDELTIIQLKENALS